MQSEINMKRAKSLLIEIAAKFNVTKATVYQAYKTQTGSHIYDDIQDINYLIEQLGYIDIPEQLKIEKADRKRYTPLLLDTETGMLLHYYTKKPL